MDEIWVEFPIVFLCKYLEVYIFKLTSHDGKICRWHWATLYLILQVGTWKLGYHYTNLQICILISSKIEATPWGLSSVLIPGLCNVNVCSWLLIPLFLKFLPGLGMINHLSVTQKYAKTSTAISPLAIKFNPLNILRWWQGVNEELDFLARVFFGPKLRYKLCCLFMWPKSVDKNCPKAKTIHLGGHSPLMA